jgi:hypothetical protein
MAGQAHGAIIKGRRNSPTLMARGMAVLFLAMLLSIPNGASAGGTTISQTSEAFVYYGPGFIQVVSPNGINSVHRLSSPITSEVALKLSILPPLANLTHLLVSLIVGGTSEPLLNETYQLQMNSSTMELSYQGKTLGFYYMWLPQLVSNGSLINRFLTIVDVNNVTYDLQGKVIAKSGLDYVVAQSNDPYIRIVNVYNASTGAAVALMIPGRSSIPRSLIETGNYTEGHTNIAYAPFGTLLGLNWSDFEPGFASLLISPSHETSLSEILAVVVPLMSEPSTSTPTSPSAQAVLLTSVSLLGVFVLILAYAKFSRLKRHSKSTRTRKANHAIW